MNIFLVIIVQTANLLGIFNDPFEFAGDYGPTVNPIRDKVFEQVVAKEALIPSGDLLDRKWGPTLEELVSSEMLYQLELKQKELESVGFKVQDVQQMHDFIHRHGKQKIFYFFRHAPPVLLSLDKILKDTAAREGKTLDLPILSSTAPLKGQNSEELKHALLNALFTKKTLSLTKEEEIVKKGIQEWDEGGLKDLDGFASPAGQVFFYWMYQALNLHLIAEDPEMIPEVNQVKEHFVHTIGNLQVRAATFKKKLLEANSQVLFTQESDALTVQELTKEGLFLPLEKQNPKDGTLVLLRSDAWEQDYEVIPVENYPGYYDGRINIVLARHKETELSFILASLHGHSTRAEDGRLQIALVVEKFREFLSKDPHLQLVMGIDANTKTAEDVRLLREHLESLGLTATDVGPTTVKQRMVTVQHKKAGKVAIDEEDYLITLKPTSGGLFIFTHPTVGFKEEKADVTKSLPHQENPSDHYPIGATLQDPLKI